MEKRELRSKFYERYVHSLNIAVEAVIANRFRSMLTALGIIFGVAAVIAMMAIGNGARKEILDQMKMVGVNNIVITPLLEKSGGGGNSEEEGGGQKLQKKFSPGLTLEDAESIRQIIPTVTRVSPEVKYDSYVIKEGKRSPAKLIGVTNDFFEVYNLQLYAGQYFQEQQQVNGSPVCIIGPSVKARFFSREDPLGKTIKCGGIWLTVIGVLENRAMQVDETKDLGISDYNDHIYAPIQTVMLRYKDRSYVNDASLRQGESSIMVIDGGIAAFSSSSSGSMDNNYNQLDKIVVQVTDSKYLDATTKALTSMLKRRHQQVDDFQVSVPELLLKQEQRTKDIFNIVLGVIAGISLLVGGIGIMNIMLASVMERTKEIGIRRATGATKRDVIFQFLSEATIISISGGVIGIVLGVVFAVMIQRTTGILTIVTPDSIVVSFGVSAFIGILFGYMPAKRASDQDPVESLRYE
ncbi:MAG: ABC transporter permease [Bacteroidales bacterium]|jgi:putative ABC transport system permease protein|nr:ABC transporter permease [Bacteroidales bacterium]